LKQIQRSTGIPCDMSWHTRCPKWTQPIRLKLETNSLMRLRPRGM